MAYKAKSDKDDPHMRVLIFVAGCRMTTDSRGMHRQSELYAQSHLASTLSQSKIPFDTMSDRDRIGTHSQRLIGRGLMMSDLKKEWKVVDGHYPGFLNIIGAAYPVSIVTSAIDLSLDDFINRTNDAHLMAAAPDLLEALESLFEVYGDEPETDYAKRVHDQVRSAISKARG